LLTRFHSAQLGEEHRKNKDAPQPANAAPTKFRRTVSIRNENDDEGSVINGQMENDSRLKQSLVCGSCRTKDSTVWWRGPRGLASPFMCDTCGIAWRKYGDIKGPPKQDEVPIKKVVPAEKREGTPLAPPVAKRQKVSKILAFLQRLLMRVSKAASCTQQAWRMRMLP